MDDHLEKSSLPFSRRTFLKGSLVGAAAVSTPTKAMAHSGAHVKKTLLAFANCIIPGPPHDPKLGPGAIDAGIWKVYTDPRFKIKSVLGILSLGLDFMSVWFNGYTFANASFEEQCKVVAWKLDHEGLFKYFDIATYGFLVFLAKACYYGGWVNHLGPKYIGFPMHGNPYVRDYSHRRKFAKEMTQDGNLP